jgi:hypothetical protein
LEETLKDSLDNKEISRTNDPKKYPETECISIENFSKKTPEKV